MATLNVKNLPDPLYRKLQARAKRERRSVAQQLTQILSEALETAPKRSIMELRGLGQEIWKDIDVSDHIRRERDGLDIEAMPLRSGPIRFCVEKDQTLEIVITLAPRPSPEQQKAAG